MTRPHLPHPLVVMFLLALAAWIALIAILKAVLG